MMSHLDPRTPAEERSMLRSLSLLLLGLLLPATSFALPITYTTTLGGANESPANPSPGTGFASVIYDDSLHTLQVQVSFADLTAGDTAAHIHCCVSPLAIPSTAGVATVTPTFTGFPTGVTSGTYDHTYDLTQASSFNSAFVTANGGTAASAEAALATGLSDGFAYLNIHTPNYPGGEIRGFLAPVPEPAAAALLAVMLGALALRRSAL
jgi:CHRD domain